MNITYEWKITALKKAPSLDGLSDVITNIRFNFTGTDSDSGKSFTFSGACPVSAPSKENFTDIKSLTEAEVIEWAKANHPTAHMEEVVEKGIKNIVQPVNEDVNDLDWLKSEESTEEDQLQK